MRECNSKQQGLTAEAEETKHDKKALILESNACAFE
jgi:hypothetical protein